jgi:hypothetical protein
MKGERDMVCPSCRKDNLHGASFCEHCGVPLNEIAHDEWKQDDVTKDNNDEIKERVDILQQNLKDALKLEPEEMKGHLDYLKKNLKLGKGDIKTRLHRFSEKMKIENLEEAVRSNEKPLKNSLITFIAWAILRLTTPFHRRIYVFLLTPLGLLTLVAISIAYGFFDKEILCKMQEMKEGIEKKRSDNR